MHATVVDNSRPKSDLLLQAWTCKCGQELARRDSNPRLGRTCMLSPLLTIERSHRKCRGINSFPF